MALYILKVGVKLSIRQRGYTILYTNMAVHGYPFRNYFDANYSPLCCKCNSYSSPDPRHLRPHGPSQCSRRCWYCDESQTQAVSQTNLHTAAFERLFFCPNTLPALCGLFLGGYMTDTKQPEALEIADLLESFANAVGEHPSGSRARAAAELRRQHTRIAELETENRALKEQHEAVGAGGVTGLRAKTGLYYLQDSRSYVGNCPLWWAKRGRGVHVKFGRSRGLHA